MNVKDAIKGRRSVHYYDSSKEVTDKQLKELFNLVKLSPSGFNLQPWEFVVVRNKKNKERLVKCAMNQKHVADASATIIVLGKLNPGEDAERIFGEWAEGSYFPKQVAEQYIPMTKSKDSDKHERRVWTTRSTALAAMTLMIAAKEMGLGSGPMEGFDPAAVKKEFKIPENYEVVMLITLGYESKKALPRLPRKGFEEIVHFEEYSKN